MKLSKKMLSVFVSVLIIVASIPISAQATELSGFTAWTATDSMPTEEGNYFLENDVTLSGAWTVPTGTTSINLNGKTLSTTSSNVINVTNDDTLSIYDEDNSGKITGGNGSWGGAIFVHGSLNIYGGTITENTASNVGGAIYLEAGTLNMYGGVISNNRATSSTAQRGGGGVCVWTGTFHMYDGTITGNAVNSMGGGVFINNGSFIMDGGTISNNTNNNNSTATKQFRFCGGGVGLYSASASFAMNDGSIINNHSRNGGGIGHNNGTTNINGGLIDGNDYGTTTNGGNGGGAYVVGGHFYMNGGTMSNNICRGSGGIRATYGDSHNGSVHIWGGTITGNHSVGSGAAGVSLYGSGSFNVKGNPQVYGNTVGTDNVEQNMFFSSGQKMSVVGSIDSTARLGVTCAVVPTYSDPVVFTSGYLNNSTSQNFISDNDAYYVGKNDAGEATLRLKMNTTPVEAVAATCTASGISVNCYIGEDGNYYEDSLGAQQLATGNVVVPANGHTPATATTENYVNPTCTDEGGYDTVVRCSVCNEILSSEHTTLPANGHTWNNGEITTPATETAPGVKTYTCTVCSATKTEDVEPLNGTSITIADTISENFYIDEEYYEAAYGDDVYVTLNYNHASNISETPNFQTQTMELSSLPALDDSTSAYDGARMLSVIQAPAQATEDITINVYASEADALAGTNPVDTITYNVYDYCRAILTGEYSDGWKELAETTLDYCAAAQTYFGYNTDNMATKDNGGEYYNSLDSADFSGVASIVKPACIKKASMVAKSDLEINLLSLSSITVTGASMEAAEGKDRFSVSDSVNGDYYEVNIKGIVPSNMNKTITITTGEGEIVLTANAIMKIMANNSNANLANMAKAMYLYGVAAYNCFD